METIEVCFDCILCQVVLSLRTQIFKNKFYNPLFTWNVKHQVKKKIKINCFAAWFQQTKKENNWCAIFLRTFLLSFREYGTA